MRAARLGVGEGWARVETLPGSALEAAAAFDRQGLDTFVDEYGRLWMRDPRAYSPFQPKYAAPAPQGAHS